MVEICEIDKVWMEQTAILIAKDRWEQDTDWLIRFTYTQLKKAYLFGYESRKYDSYQCCTHGEEI